MVMGSVVWITWLIVLLVALFYALCCGWFWLCCAVWSGVCCLVVDCWPLGGLQWC